MSGLGQSDAPGVKRVAVGVLAICAMGALVYMLANPARVEPTAPAPKAEIPETPPTPAVPPTVAVDPPPVAPVGQDPKRQEIKVRAAHSVGSVFLSVVTQNQPVRLLRVKSVPAERARQGRWEAYLEICAFIATELEPTAPRGLRVQLDVGALEPQPGMIGALVTGIRVALRGGEYPLDVLIDGMVSPDGSLVAIGPSDRLDRLAMKAGLKTSKAPTLDRLLIDWGHLQRPAPTKPVQSAGGAPADLYAVNVDKLRNSLRQVLGEVMAKRPAKLPLPDDWRGVVARVETRLTTASVRSVDQLLSLGVAGALIRRGARMVPFTEQRLQKYTARLIRDETRLDGWPQVWLTELVTIHVLGEELIQEWSRVLPPARPQPRALVLPRRTLRARSDALRKAGRAFTTVLTGHVSRASTMPRPYPFNDARVLTWPSTGVQDTRAVAADWGTQLVHTGLVWTQLCVSLALEPRKQITTAELGALIVDDTERLERLVRQSQAGLNHTGQLGRTAEGTLPLEVRRLVGRHEHAKTTTTTQVRALEDFWLASVFNREVARFRTLMGGGPGAPR